MKVTVAVAALAAAASATELTERQDGHNSKPCPNKPAVTSVCCQHFQISKLQVTNYLLEEARIRHHLQEAHEGRSATPGLRLQLPCP
jgi:hypothetical protein